MPHAVRPKLYLVTTVSHGLETYLAGQPRLLSRSFDVTLVSSPSAGLDRVGLAEGVVTKAVPMTRTITPRQDLRALIGLYRLFRRDRPAIVQTYSPKAGLLGMAAARAARVPVRVHGIIGLPLMEAVGWRARLLRLTERLTYLNATRLTCNSVGLRSWMQQVLTRRPVHVIGRGSVNGVDLQALQPPSEDERRAARQALGLTEGHCVYAFFGRLVRDKGVVELVEAFAALHERHPDCRLLLVGEQEDGSLPPETLRMIEQHPAVLSLGWRREVREVYDATDVLVLPSYREGMPNVILEAAAMALPVIATDINGSNELVTDGRNGILVPVRDAAALAAAMAELLSATLRQRMGRSGREVVEADFEQEDFCDRLAGFYDQLLVPR